MSDISNARNLLGVSADASDKQIRNAWIEKVKQLGDGGEEETGKRQALNEAYETLKSTNQLPMIADAERQISILKREKELSELIDEKWGERATHYLRAPRDRKRRNRNFLSVIASLSLILSIVSFSKIETIVLAMIGDKPAISPISLSSANILGEETSTSLVNAFVNKSAASLNDADIRAVDHPRFVLGQISQVLSLISDTKTSPNLKFEGIGSVIGTSESEFQNLIKFLDRRGIYSQGRLNILLRNIIFDAYDFEVKKSRFELAQSRLADVGVVFAILTLAIAACAGFAEIQRRRLNSVFQEVSVLLRDPQNSALIIGGLMTDCGSESWRLNELTQRIISHDHLPIPLQQQGIVRRLVKAVGPEMFAELLVKNAEEQGVLQRTTQHIDRVPYPSWKILGGEGR